MKSKMKTSLKILIGVVLAGGLLFGLWQVWCIATTSEYKSFTSPDGRFKVVVYRRAMLIALPGQSGDAPGYVKLVDEEGRVLGKKKVNMVQIIEESVILWKEDYVFIGPLSVKWELPPKE